MNRIFGKAMWSAMTLIVAVCGMLSGASPAWAAHAYAQFGDIKYPPGFHHFDYVNPKAPKGGQIAIVANSIASSFDKYNPFTLKGTEPPGMEMLVFETLMTGSSDEPATVYGLLAEDIDVSPDRLSVTFRLNPKARFQNGDPVLAKDVKHSFDMLTSKQAAPQYPAYFSGVDKAEILGERTIRFTLRRPDPELPIIVGSLPVFSHKWGVVNGQRKPFDQIVTEMPIASGPYRIGPINYGRDITYVRDKNYWAEDLNVHRGTFNFDRITYRLYTDNVASFEAFKAGEFDFIQSFISKDWARQYKGGKFDSGELVKRELIHRNAAGFQGFVFNTRDPKLKDPRVRLAFDLCMDFEWMRRQLFYNIYRRLPSYFANSEYEAKGLPGPDELALLEPLRKQLDPAVLTQPVPLPPSTSPPGSLRDNLKRARDLLKAAGWTIQDGVMRNAKGEPLVLEILDNSPSFGKIITQLKRNMGKLGIELNYKVVDYAVYEKRVKNFEFEVITLALPGRLIPGSELKLRYHSSAANTPGSSNLGGVADPAIDALIEKAMSAKTRPELATAVRALDRVLRHGHYAALHWYSNAFRVAWRNGRFGQPTPPPYYQPEGWALAYWWSL